VNKFAAMQKLLLLIISLLFSSIIFAQQIDTNANNGIENKDSLNEFRDTSSRNSTDSLKLSTDSANNSDSLAAVALIKKTLTWKEDTLFRIFFTHSLLSKNAKPIMMISEERKPSSNDNLFYLLTGLAFFLGFLKLTFPKYFQNLFRLFLQSGF